MSEIENIEGLKLKLEKADKKNRQLWKMNEAVYREKKKSDELNDMLMMELDKSESEKSKFKEKNKKLWTQSVAIHKEKERIDSLKKQLEHRNKEILDSINYAKRIQAAILPSERYMQTQMPEHFVLYKPKDIVAGDFYWLESHVLNAEDEDSPKGVLFGAADCTGHGVPGALVSVICNNALNRSVREFGLRKPGEILDKTREIVITEFEKSDEEVKDGMDVALCALNWQSGELQYAGANNPLWIIRSGAHEVEETKADKQPIGKYGIEKPFTNHYVNLSKGDTLYIFSDGYADQFGGEKGKKLKAKNFKTLLLSMQNESMEKQRELIDEAFEKWKGSFEQLDDVCVIGVRV